MKILTTNDNFKSSYINGVFTSKEVDTFKVFNPANNNCIAELIDGKRTDVQDAINAANNAFPKWRALLAKERSEILNKWYNLILEHKEELAYFMTLECGKPINESRGEVEYGASFIKWFSEEGKRTYGDLIPSPIPQKRISVLKQPIGVVGTITPWNFPLAMITRKVAPALAVGCTVVIRPSEETPLTALALAKLAHFAGFPTGVFNVTIGSDPSEMGKEMCESPLVKKISFTGSTRVGRILMNQSSSTLKKLSLELGGNAPFIVFEDADIDEAVGGAISAKYRNSGQTCVCTNRFIIHEKVFDDFSKKFISAVSKLKYGDGFDQKNQIGPLINSKAITRVKNLITDCEQKGAKILLSNSSQNSNYISPVIITDIQKDMDIYNEEIFGPISTLYKFSSDTEAINMANSTPYGLASYFYTNDLTRAHIVSEALEFGMVGINTGLISNEVAPFGGIKDSGFGREGSKYGVDDYLNLKYICTQI